MGQRGHQGLGITEWKMEKSAVIGLERRKQVVIRTENKRLNGLYLETCRMKTEVWGLVIGDPVGPVGCWTLRPHRAQSFLEGSSGVRILSSSTITQVYAVVCRQWQLCTGFSLERWCLWLGWALRDGSGNSTIPRLMGGPAWCIQLLKSF